MQQHSAHFNTDFESNFDKFTTAIVGQLVTVPLPSPASGFTYEFDPATGVFRRTTGSFGPILAERAETVGAGRFSLGAAFQRFTFQTVEGLDLSKVPAVFTHDSAELLGGRQDVVTTINAIEARVSQFTTYVTVGVTDRFDVLGRFYVNAERLGQETFHARDNVHQYPNIVFSRDSFNALSGSIGVKINVRDRLLLDGNLLFALDEHGVRDRVVPLVALEYAF